MDPNATEDFSGEYFFQNPGTLFINSFSKVRIWSNLMIMSMDLIGKYKGARDGRYSRIHKPVI